MNDGILSEIRMFTGPLNTDTYSLKDWKLCNGESLLIQDYEALFSLLGCRYGGDGKVKFALPNLRGKIPAGTGLDHEGIMQHYPQGKEMGSESVTLEGHHLPSHSHSGSIDVSIPVLSTEGSTNVPTRNYLANIPPAKMYSNQGNTSLKPFQAPVVVEMSKQETGVTAPISVMQSYQVVNFLICVNGIYPRRPWL